MYLYKFRIFDTNALTALSNRQLWFGTLDSQNDPFEGECIIDSVLSDELIQFAENNIFPQDPESASKYAELTSIHNPQTMTSKQLLEMGCEQMVRGMMGNVRKTSRICSLSSYSPELELDPLYDNRMWGHYSDGLRGFCLVFDSQQLKDDLFQSSGSKAMPFKIVYQNNPDMLRVSELVTVDKKTGLKVIDTLEAHEIVAKAVSTKSKHWDYEQEVRIVSLSHEPLLKYSNTALAKIIIGEKMPKPQLSLLKNILESAYPQTEVLQMYMSSDSYNLNYRSHPTIASN